MQHQKLVQQVSATTIKSP